MDRREGLSISMTWFLDVNRFIYDLYQTSCVPFIFYHVPCKIDWLPSFKSILHEICKFSGNLMMI